MLEQDVSSSYSSTLRLQETRGRVQLFCKVVDALHGRLKKKDSGSGKDADAVFSCCKVSVKEKKKHLDLTI